MATLSSILPPVNLSTASGTLPVGNGGTGATTLTGVVKGSGSSALTAGTVTVAEGGTGATTLTANNVLLGNGTGALQTVAPGTAGNVLSSNGTSWISQAIASASVQEFSSSGTWTKPSGANFVLVEVWGAGGGGGRPTAGASNAAGGGGGGGSYNYRLFSASELSSTVAVTIGAGGTGGFANGSAGNNGGSTNFGLLIYGYGGGFGSGNGTSIQSGGGGGGVLGASTSSVGGAPLIADVGTSTSIILAQNMGGGRGGGQVVAGASTIDESNGSASSFGGGGGCASYTSGAVTVFGGGSSSNGGGGGGCGGYSTTGGSSLGDRAPVQGGGAVPTNRGTQYGAAGGGGIPVFGLTAPYAANSLQGGGGGIAAVTLTTYNSNLFFANNGAQTVVSGAVNNLGIPFATMLLFVSSNGLSNYTAYSTGRSGNNAGILHDGSKYVIATIAGNQTRKFYASIYSTTDFVTFTDYAVPNILITSSLNTTENGFKYLNGRYFLCMSTDLYYSSDLVTWTRANVAGGTTADIRSMTYDGTRYYALRSTGVVYVSTDLTSWVSYASGVGVGQSIAASSSVVVATGLTQSKYSTDGGVNWVNLPTIAASVGRIVRFISATSTWLITTSTPDIYYSTTPTSSWTLATDSASATNYRDIGYNGTNYIAVGDSTGANVASATSSLGSAFTLQAASTLTVAATRGSPGGIAGGGGGGAASSTTTSNGGAGGDGYCRVYTW